MMRKRAEKAKMTLDMLARMTESEFLSVERKITDIRGHMATKDDLKAFATQDDLRSTEAKILQAVDKVVTKFDAAEKDRAAHTVLHKRITDELHNHNYRIKKLEAKV